MKTWFDYCYYRISKFYENWGEKDGHFMGSLLVLGSLSFYFLSLLALVFSLLKIKFSTVLIGCILCVFIIISLFFIDKKKYKELELRYKNEKYHKLKGWLVFLYVISSFLLYFVSLYIFKA